MTEFVPTPLAALMSIAASASFDVREVPDLVDHSLWDGAAAAIWILMTDEVIPTGKYIALPGTVDDDRLAQVLAFAVAVGQAAPWQATTPMLIASEPIACDASNDVALMAMNLLWEAGIKVPEPVEFLVKPLPAVIARALGWT